MKHTFLKAGFMVMASALVLSACKKTPDVGILETGNYTDTTAALKEATDLTLGVAVDYTPTINDANYLATAKRDFDQVTFTYQMKHGAIVQNNGSYNFTNTDAMVSAVGNTDIYGHTLGWHQNQNATYLQSYAGITVAAATELLQNGGFENGGATNFTNWSTYNAANGATITVGSGTEVRTGTRSLKVVNPVAHAGQQYQVQLASDIFTTIPGRQYIVSYWVKAATAGGSIRLSTGVGTTGGSAQYQGDQTIGTTYSVITWNITANSSQTRILFDMGLLANTYYIDDASVKEVIAAPSGSQIAAKVDTALGNWITTIVTRYKSKVKAWDVVNELFTDAGALRNNANTPQPTTTTTDWFVWSEYLGRDYALKAFNYAKAADPNALLFINDYNLESSNQKLDSLIAMVAELKGRGAKVDGIGTQMHIAWNTSQGGIDNMFRKLAATGLQIRVSELDVKTVLGSAAGGPTPLLLGYQAAMYKYAVQSYLKNIPKAQQYGITIWGLTDNTSWLYNSGKEFPLIYNANYSKKPAYSGVLQALQGK